MKIKFYTKYTNIGASSRYRTFQFINLYRKSNIQVEVDTLFNDIYLKNLYKKKKKSKINVLFCYVKRFFSIFNSYKYDLIIIEKELFPYIPYFLESIIFFFNKKIILDYDDAIFHNYDKSKILNKKIGLLMKKSKAVTVGSNYLYDYASKYNNRVYKIPTSVNIDKYNYKKDIFDKDYINIGWIGTPATTKFLKEIIDPLKVLSQKQAINLVLIGADKRFKIEGVNIKHMEWDEETEARLIEQFDIGIMPLNDEDFAKGKCGLKLIQYMACGIPVIASPIGENEIIVKNGINGYLAKDEKTWIEYLLILCKNTELRKKMGYEGRKIVKEKYSLDIVGNNLIKIFNKLLKE